MQKKILYISYDGMTDQLGQSQVIPYLAGLSKKGYSLHVISCEKKNKFSAKGDYIKKLLKENNIEWHPLAYTKWPPVLSTLRDIFSMKRKAMALHRKESFQIVHCRSYIAALIGVSMKRKTGIKFIFDMRGFWADERVEGGLWNLKNPVYKSVFNFFKKKEIEFFNEADYSISLTEAGKSEINGWKNILHQPIPMAVIPCCADTELFSAEKITEQDKVQLRSELKISRNDFIISYLGAIGTWYLLDEMMIFFGQLLKSKPQAKFLFVTNESPHAILSNAKKYSIPEEKIIIRFAERTVVPALLSLSDISVFFIKPCFSKTASSPTKLGELMAMGIPVICNSGVGDVEAIMQKTQAGVALKDFSEPEMKRAIEAINSLTSKDRNEIRQEALKYFSLEFGVEKYAGVYEKLFRDN